MPSTARLKRLRSILQPHLDALPDRTPTESILSHSDASGGVPLDLADAPSKQPPPAPLTPQPEPAPIPDNLNTDRRFVWLNDAHSSYNPAPMPNRVVSTQPPHAPAPLPATNLHRGDLGSATHHYSPIVALSKYPYKWCNKNLSQPIASTFFDQAKFWAREWDL